MYSSTAWYNERTYIYFIVMIFDYELVVFHTVDAYFSVYIHTQFPLIKDMFYRAWLKKEAGRPRIMRIYKLRNPPTVFEAFKATSDRLGNHQPR